MAELIVALDYPDADSALAMARKLENTVTWVKVGLELHTAAGPDIIARLADLGFSIFLDLKFFDIPNTVKGAVASAVRGGASIIDLHLLGGQAMAAAALEGRDLAMSPGQNPLLYGITILTSMNREDLPWDNPGLENTVLDLAAKGSQWGLDGVVCSARECAGIKRACGPNFGCLTPGIRPRAGQAVANDDQQRTLSPAQAVANGSDFLVIGRPVTQAPDPVRAARDVLREMA